FVCCPSPVRAQVESSPSPSASPSTSDGPPSRQERRLALAAAGSNVSVSTEPAEFEYQYGLALAQLEFWNEARAAFEAGSRLAPRDKRFSIELAGVAFREKNNLQAISYLRRALRLDPKDDYANEFLATLYFLQGNLEAAVKYWNAVNKPQIAQVRIEPALRVRPGLLDHAFAVAPESSLLVDELRATDARVRNLEIFPSYRFDLTAKPDGKFDAVFRAQEVNGLGNTRTEALLRSLSGLPFQEIDPEYSNLDHSAINLASQLRWDADKRRYV